MLENEYIKKLEVETIELTPEMNEDIKVKHLFKVLVNNYIEKENNKLDLKDAKNTLKEANIDPVRLTEAIKYTEADGINKKMIQAEMVEGYMVEIKNGGEKFEGLDKPLISTLVRIEETKEGNKNLKDISGQVGVDFKALDKIAKDYVNTINPNKKAKKEDIVLEGIIEEYSKKIKG